MPLIAALVLLVGACGPSADDEAEPRATAAALQAAQGAPDEGQTPGGQVAPTPSSTAEASQAAAVTARAGASESPAGTATTAGPPGSDQPAVAGNCEPPVALPAVGNVGTGVAADDGVRVRAGPGGACKVVEALATGARVELLSGPVEADERLWVLVRAGGVEGWVAQEFIGIDDAAGGEVPVLVYHHLDQPDSDWSVTSAQLAEQLAWLKDNGYQSVTISRLVRALRGEAELPDRAVVITNDDGYPETPAFAAILRRHGFVATYYLPSRTDLTPDQIKALEADGGEVCAHTATHRDLTQLDAVEQRAEIADNQAFLERILGHPVRCFAYPFGRGNDETVAILKELGFESAVVMDGGPVRLGERVDPFRIGRVPALGDLTVRQFAAVFPEGADADVVAEEQLPEGAAVDEVLSDPVVEEPVPEQGIVYEEPVPAEPVYQEPIYEEPVPAEEPVYAEEPAYNEPPYVPEPVYEQPVYEEPAAEETTGV